MPAENITIVAGWSTNSYTLTLDPNGVIYPSIPSGWDFDSVLNTYTRVFDYGSTVVMPSAPIREGHSFTGWSGSVAFMPARDTTLVAGWSINSYTLTLDLSGIIYSVTPSGWDFDTALKTYSKIHEYGSTVEMPVIPAREGYSSTGWSRILSSMPAENITIVAGWNINSYTLTLDLNGVTYPDIPSGWDFDNTLRFYSKMLNYGSVVVMPSVPTREGYTFTEWSRIISAMPAEDTRIVAGWDINNYVLTLDPNGGAYDVVPSGWDHNIIAGTYTSTYEYNSEITIPTPLVREGYTFAGWSENLSTMPARDTALVAGWTINNYTLTVDLNGGTYGAIPLGWDHDVLTDVYTRSYDYGSAVDVTVPTREGHSFTRWSGSVTIMPATDMTLVAGWAINSYTLSLNLNGGIYESAISGWDYDSVTKTYTSVLDFDSAVTMPTIPIREGHTFTGWSRTITEMPAEDLVISACWDINSYTLTLDPNSGTYSNVLSGWNYDRNTNLYSKALYFDSVVIMPSVPLREGHSFIAWSRVITKMPAENTTIVAGWDINSYTLVLDPNGGTYDPAPPGWDYDGISKTYSRVFDYGTTSVMPTVPIRTGYSFTGWSQVISTMPAGNTTIVAGWDVNSYTLTLDHNGGTYTTSPSGWDYDNDSKTYGKTIDYNETVIMPTAPTREGHSFTGWSRAITIMPAEDVTIVAEWCINSYTLTLDPNGGMYSTLPLGWNYNSITKIYTSIFEYNSNITIPTALIRVGHTFIGWSETVSTMPAVNTTIVAGWSINSYTLTLDPNGGTYTTPPSGWDYDNDSKTYGKTVDYNATISMPTAPTREGYSFTGWSRTVAKMPAEATTIVAEWSINSYTLTLNPNGGTCETIPSGWDHNIIAGTYTSTFEYNFDVTIPIVLVRVGYTFTGWSETVSTMPAQKMTIVACWNINSYTLTLDPNGGTYTTPPSGWDYDNDSKTYGKTVDYNETVVMPTAPTREGHSFTGWSETMSTMPAVDTILVADWDINSYILTLDLNGTVYSTVPSEWNYDSIMKVYTQTLDFESEVVLPPIPIREGHSFTGWSGSVTTMPAVNTTIVAGWSINSYELTLNLDGGTYSITPSGWDFDSVSGNYSQTPDYDTTIIMPSIPTREGYSFTGWSRTVAKMPAEATTIVAEWSINSYTLTLNPNGGMCETIPSGWDHNSAAETYTSTFEYNSDVTIPIVLVRVGYTFSGWSETISIMPAQNTTIVAGWNINSYALTLDPNGGTYTTPPPEWDYDNDSKTYGKTVDYNATVLMPTTPTREGYSFTGWSRSVTTMPAMDTIIIAGWNVNHYTLTIDPNGGTYQITPSGWNHDSSTMTYYQTLDYGSDVVLSIPVREGHTFTGWSKTVSTMPAADTIVTAEWQINSYTLTAELNGGIYGVTPSGWDYNVLADVYTRLYDYGSDVTLTNPTREGHTFTGWSETVSTIPATDTTVTAEWEINSYILTLDLDGGTYDAAPSGWDYDILTGVCTRSYDYGTSVSMPANPTREHYTFDGWDQVVTTITGDVEVSALWDACSYTLSVGNKVLYTIDGKLYTKPKVLSVTVESVIELSPVANYELPFDYFTGKMIEDCGGYYKVNGDVTLPNICKVSYYGATDFNIVGKKIFFYSESSFHNIINPKLQSNPIFTFETSESMLDSFIGWNAVFEGVEGSQTYTSGSCEIIANLSLTPLFK